MVNQEGRFEESAAFCHESYELFRKIGNETSMLFGLSVSGLALRRMGDLLRAGSIFRECLDHPLANQISSALAHYGLGLMALESSEATATLEQFKESVVLLHQNVYLRLINIVPEAVARAAIQASEAVQAAQLYASIEALRERQATPLPPSEFEAFQTDMEAVREALALHAIAQEWAVGRELTLDEAVSLAPRVISALTE